MLEVSLDREVGMPLLLTLSLDLDVGASGVAPDEETMFSMAMARGCTLHTVTAASLEMSSQHARWIASETASRAVPNTAHRSFAGHVLPL